MSRRSGIYYAAGVVTVLTLLTFKRLLFPGESEAHTQPKRKKALFFGDSITQHGLNPSINGWLCQFADWWTRRVDVINRGFSGYNSRWGVLIVDEVVVSENPDIVFVFFGANDAVDTWVGQHVPLVEYKSNMEKIFDTLQTKLPKAKLVIITPPPIWEEKLEEMNRAKGRHPTLDRTNERTLQYASVCKDLGAQRGIPVVDAWTSMEGNNVNRANFLSDGLHLNSAGNTKLFKAARAVISRYYPEFTQEALPMHMMEWSQMIEMDKQRGITGSK